MLFSAELPVWFICAQENGFLVVPENSQKITRKSTHPKEPGARSGTRGETWGPQAPPLAWPGVRPRPLAAWAAPPSSGALPRLLFIPVTRKPQNKSRFPSFRRGASATLCSSSGGLIWRLIWPPERGDRRHRHHHHQSIHPP